jgi:Immunity protein 8
MSVRADLKSLFVPDYPLADQPFIPDDPENFGIHVVAFVGVDGSDESSAFDFIACTAGWLATNDDITSGLGFTWAERDHGAAILRGYVLMGGWDLSALERRIAELCRSIEGPDEDTVATLVNRYLPWEYDYRVERDFVVRSRRE